LIRCKFESKDIGVFKIFKKIIGLFRRKSKENSNVIKKSYNNDEINEYYNSQYKAEYTVKLDNIVLAENISKFNTIGNDNKSKNSKTYYYENLKKYYYHVFNNNSILNEVIDIYIDITNEKLLFESIRLRILTFYLFVKEITENKKTESEIISIIMLRKNNNIMRSKEFIDTPSVELDSDTNNIEKINKIYSERVKINYKEIKKYYYTKFDNSKDFDEVIDIYIKVTNEEVLFDIIRVRIIAFYLFIKEITDEKYNELDMINIIKSRSNILMNEYKHKEIKMNWINNSNSHEYTIKQINNNYNSYGTIVSGHYRKTKSGRVVYVKTHKRR